VVLVAVTWAVALALYQSWVGGPDLWQKQQFDGAAALAVGLVALASFPYLAGYVVCLALYLGGRRCGETGLALTYSRSPRGRRRPARPRRALSPALVPQPQ
jgi:hypothetical protein